MELEIKHLGQTLAVGGVAIYSVLFLLRTIQHPWIPTFFARRKTPPASAVGAVIPPAPSASSTPKVPFQRQVVVLTLILAAGILLEDWSKHYAAGRTSLKDNILLNWILDHDRELRLRSLFDVVETNDKQTVLKPRPLANELLESTQTRKVQTYYQAVKLMVDPAGNKPAQITIPAADVEKLQSAINGMFYDAKNRVYQQDNYFSELTEISNRADFTRALSFLFLLLCGLYLIFGILSFIPPIARRLHIDKSERHTIVVLTVLFFAGMWLSSTVYRIETYSYDARVFGYSLVLDKP